MSVQKKTLIVLIVITALTGVVNYHHHVAVTDDSQLTGLALQTQTKPLVLDVRSKETDCQVNGSLPDPACTPGAVFPDATREIICVSGYTKTVRSVSVSLKKRVYAEYGISYPQPTGSYEADHFIPLELGGSNDIANLFPEAANPTPGFREKDLVENYLHQEMCSRRIPLAIAQKLIADNWLDVYNTLTPEKIKELKSQFSSSRTNY